MEDSSNSRVQDKSSAKPEVESDDPDDYYLEKCKYLSVSGLFHAEDKLTPSIVNISISSDDNSSTSNKRPFKAVDHILITSNQKYRKKDTPRCYSTFNSNSKNDECLSGRKLEENTSDCPLKHPYGSCPLPLKDTNKKRSSKSKLPKLSQPDFSSPMWFKSKCFDRYWSTYNFAMDWYRNHVKAMAEFAPNIDTCYQSFYKSNFPMPDPVAHNKGQKSKSSKKKRRARNRRLQKQKKLEENQKRMAANMEIEEESEVEVSDVMMAFFEKSMMHKLLRDNSKQLDEDGNVVEMERVDIEEVKYDWKPPSSLAPKQQPGVRRNAEMRQLYGDGAPMIQGMETALQMTFDRLSDKFQPKLWPNMPLNIVF